MSIKDLIKKNKSLFFYACVVKHWKSTDFKDYVIGYKNDPEIVKMKKGSIQGEKPICRITAWNKDEGFCAGLKQALHGAYFCRTHGFVPYIFFCKDSLYTDSSMLEDLNPYEYFFEGNDPNCITGNTHPEVIYQGRNSLCASEDASDGYSDNSSRSYIDCLAQIWGNEIRFNKRTEQIIQQHIEDMRINKEFLGVHIRGTDYKAGYKKHPVYVEPEAFYPYIREAMEKHNFTKIYVSTDDIDILDELKNRFGTEILVYDRTITRVRGKKGVHTTSPHGYKNGIDVIKDISGLVACGGLITGVSQVALITRVMKKSKNEEYLYDKTISKGIVKRGNSFSVNP